MSDHEHGDEHGHGHGDESHEVPYGIFVLIWLGLMMLTGTTVVAAGVDLGRASIVVAMAIATAKVTLVGFFFMHLKYESLMLRIMVGMSVGILAVVIVLTFSDTGYRG